MASKLSSRPDADEIIALMRQARARGRGRRSPLMVWMQENQAALEAAFAQTAPAWSVLASYLGERGVTDGDGKLPSARTARETWARVKAEAGVKAKTLADRLVSTLDPSPAIEKPSLCDSNQTEAAPPRRTFGYVTPRGLNPAAKPPVPPAPSPSTKAEPPTPASPTVNADDVLARFAPDFTRR